MQEPTNPYQSYWKRLWHIWGPFLIQMVISMVVSSAAAMMYMLMFHYKDIEAIALSGSQSGMQDMILSIDQELARYSTLIAGVAALVTIPVMLVLFHMDRKKEKTNGIVPNKKAALWKYIGVAVMAVTVCLGLNNLISIGNLATVDESYEASIQNLYSASFPTQIICLVILVPMAEELVFRGLIFKRLREQAGFTQAALYSALVFGLIHNSMVEMMYGFAVGMMLAYVYEKYGSVKAPILAHMAMNLFSVVATKYHVLDWMMKDIMRVGIITVACAAIGATMFVLIQRIDEKPELPKPEDEKENLAAM